MHKTWARVTVKLIAAYVAAAIPGTLVLSLSGPHGPLMSLPEAFVSSLLIPKEALWRMTKGDFSMANFLLGLLGFPLAMALAIVAFTEWRRSKRQAIGSN
jgi:hypothetical protein